MTGRRQKNQYSPALEPAHQGETPASGSKEAEPVVAKPAPQRPALTEQLMEEVCDRENLVRAWKRVRQNKGSPGVDGMTIGDAKDYLREHWPSIRSQLLEGTYQPQPVKRVEIPKPDGGIRKLGVPCVAKARRDLWGKRCATIAGHRHYPFSIDDGDTHGVRAERRWHLLTDIIECAGLHQLRDADKARHCFPLDDCPRHSVLERPKLP